jgi:hypothetical protein
MLKHELWPKKAIKAPAKIALAPAEAHRGLYNGTQSGVYQLGSKALLKTSPKSRHLAAIRDERVDVRPKPFSQYS